MRKATKMWGIQLREKDYTLVGQWIKVFDRWVQSIRPETADNNSDPVICEHCQLRIMRDGQALYLCARCGEMIASDDPNSDY